MIGIDASTLTNQLKFSSMWRHLTSEWRQTLFWRKHITSSFIDQTSTIMRSAYILRAELIVIIMPLSSRTPTGTKSVYCECHGMTQLHICWVPAKSEFKTLKLGRESPLMVKRWAHSIVVAIGPELWLPSLRCPKNYTTIRFNNGSVFTNNHLSMSVLQMVTRHWWVQSRLVIEIKSVSEGHLLTSWRKVWGKVIQLVDSTGTEYTFAYILILNNCQPKS